MRAFRRNSLTCDRVRERICAEVDGELSIFERRLVDAHERSCPDCLDFRQSVRRIAAAMRSTPLEPLPRPIALPVRHRLALRARSFQLAGATAAVAFMAGVTAWSVVSDPEHALEPARSELRVEQVVEMQKDWQLRVVEKRVLSRHSDDHWPGPQLV